MADNSVEHRSAVTAKAPPVAPAPARQLSDEEKRTRYAELRQRIGRSRLKVDCPPGKTAYWARKEDAAELSRLEWLGFEIVHDNPTAPQYKASGLKADGTYCLGDVVLMSIDTDLYQMLLEENERKSHEAKSLAKDNFLERAAEAEVPTFETGGKK